MKTDERVLAGFLSGSARSSGEDEYSDVDAVFIVQPEAFGDITSSVGDFFGEICDEVELVWAERFNTADHHNYAVLMRAGEHLLQYDINIDTPDFQPVRKVLRDQILFDKTGLLEAVEKLPLEEFSPGKIKWHIEAYWVWMYIHAKYLARRDFVKLIYVQQELFNNHLVVVRNLYEQALGFAWWPQAVKALPREAKRTSMMRYLCHQDIDSVRKKLKGQIDEFKSDARRLCSKLEIDYPVRLETAVLEHLKKTVGKL
jgi:hypothetical protein